MKDAAGAPDVTVVLPAAGSGARIGGERKQHRDLGGAPLLVQTLRPFDRHPLVALIVVVSPAAELSLVRSLVDESDVQKPVSVVAGGLTRQASVRLGLKAAEKYPFVLVHDAVRPFITQREITDVIAATRAHGAAALAIPVADTLRHAERDVFGNTVSRADLFRMQTPQGFMRSLIVGAHEAAAETDPRATDDVEVVQRAGHDVYLVEGSSWNFKITTPEDWDQAQLLWDRWSAREL